MTAATKTTFQLFCQLFPLQDIPAHSRRRRRRRFLTAGKITPNPPPQRGKRLSHAGSLSKFHSEPPVLETLVFARPQPRLFPIVLHPCTPMLRSTLRSTRLTRSFHTTRFSLADAKESASKAADSAKQAATKASANAQEYASKALEQSQKLAKAIGDTSGKILQNAGPRVNGLVDRVAGLQKPIVYWGKVGGEVAKQGILSAKTKC